MKHSKKYIFIVLVIFLTFGCDSKISKGEQITIVTLDNNLDAQDQKVFKDIHDSIKQIIGITIKLNDPDLRNTYEKMSVNADISTDQLSYKKYLEIQSIIKTKFNGKLLQDNNKGALIYCLDNNKTFEIHQPFIISKKKYDMNNQIENKGIFKIIQLTHDWNISVTEYKKEFKECRR